MISRILFYRHLMMSLLLIFITFWYYPKAFAAVESLNPIENKTNTSGFLFLTIADIHFNPFASCEQQPKPCPLIQKLIVHKSNQWADIFRQEKFEPINNNTHSDTHYPLLISLQKTLKLQKPQFVLVMGDFLTHSFYQKYITYSNDPKAQHYSAFVAKTNRFIETILSDSFDKNTPIFPVIGNGDTDNKDCANSDYCETLSNQHFFHTFAKIWEQKLQVLTPVSTLNTENKQNENDVHQPQNQNAWKNSFSKWGYYRVPASDATQPNLLILNSVMFSKKLNSTEDMQLAEQQLTWLSQQLQEIQAHHQKAWLIMHIPPGIDAYVIYKDIFRRITPFWHNDNTLQLLDLLKQYHNVITILLSAHTHMDQAMIIRLQYNPAQCDPTEKTAIVDTMTPSISPIFGNNPAFKLYSYNSKLQLTNFKVYFLPLSQPLAQWKLEYDFKSIYLKNCNDCTLLTGLIKISPNVNDLYAQKYIQYFSAEGNPEPITDNFGYAYYWCALRTPIKSGYNTCFYRQKTYICENHRLLKQF